MRPLSEVLVWFAGRANLRPVASRTIIAALGDVRAEVRYLCGLGLLHRRYNRNIQDATYALVHQRDYWRIQERKAA